MVTRQSLLGMFQQNPDQFQTLLGQYYDPKQAKMQWLGGTLQGLGQGIASGEPGAWAQGAIAGGGQGVDDYKRQALLGYKVGQDQQDQAWQNKAHARQEQEWNQEDASSQQINSMLGSISDPGQRMWAQMDPKGYLSNKYGSQNDPKRYNVGGALVDASGNVIYSGPDEVKPPQIEPFYDETTGQEYKAQFNPATGSWDRIGGTKADSNGITVGPDGTVQIGGPGKKPTESDNKAILLQRQAEGSFDTALKYFDDLSSPQNTVGANVPGGRVAMTDQGQAGDDALTNIVANWLYLTSGATASPQEVANQVRILKPSAVDGDITKAAKKARLELMIDSMRTRAGVAPSGAAAPGAPTVRNYNPSTGKLE
jgi:hypothetical protein